MLSRAFYLLVAGAAGGLIGWLFTEPFAPRTMSDAAWTAFGQRFGLMSGLWIGLLVGALSGWGQGSKVHLFRGAAFGALLGAVGGTLGLQIGNAVYNALNSASGVPLVGGPMGIIARGIGWGLFGSIIGAAEGAVGRSAKRMFQGLVGGFLGGVLGGAAFEVSSHIFAAQSLALQGGNEVGAIPRAVGLVVLGGGIGLLIGIVESLGRSAWVRLILGRNEGKEWLIDAPTNILGRSEGAHVPLFGDPQVAPQHAFIVHRNGMYWLQDAGSPMGTGLNGQRINEAPLTSGDMIQIAGFQLEFMLRSGRAQRIPQDQRMMAAAPQPIQPMQPVSPGAGVAVMQQTVAFPASTSVPTTAFTPTVASRSLVATNGPLAGTRFSLDQPIEAGRESGGIALGFDTMASRRHASFTPSPNGVSVNDLGSTNGTMVNGSRVTAQLLKIGDMVQIGSTTFRVE